jgi:hypothetical protein
MNDIQVNHAIRHQLIDLSDVIIREKWKAFIWRALRLAEWLNNVVDDEEILSVDNLRETFPRRKLEFNWVITDDMWSRLLTSLKRVRELRSHDDGDVLYGMQYVLSEQNQLIIHKRIKVPYPTYLSILRYTLLDEQPVLMAVTATMMDDHMYEQIHITQFPTMWIYKIMHPGCCDGSNAISMLMHSITTHAMKQLHPSLTRLTIGSPFKHMREIFEQAAKNHHFTFLVNNSIQLDIDISNNDNPYVTLWRRHWGTESIRVPLCVACFAKAIGTCADVWCCSDECADTQWKSSFFLF